ncbi:MAG: hypothetical protein K2N34_06465 [Lachnospiraceae bacterium]|nr:hypothetical protein [Lachnospiraceae bacterium]
MAGMLYGMPRRLKEIHGRKEKRLLFFWPFDSGSIAGGGGLRYVWV